MVNRGCEKRIVTNIFITHMELIRYQAFRTRHFVYHHKTLRGAIQEAIKVSSEASGLLVVDTGAAQHLRTRKLSTASIARIHGDEEAAGVHDRDVAALKPATFCPGNKSAL